MATIIARFSYIIAITFTICCYYPFIYVYIISFTFRTLIFCSMCFVIVNGNELVCFSFFFFSLFFFFYIFVVCFNSISYFIKKSHFSLSPVLTIFTYTISVIWFCSVFVKFI